jgi:hypothetical protein
MNGPVADARGQPDTGSDDEDAASIRREASGLPARRYFEHH